MTDFHWIFEPLGSHPALRPLGGPRATRIRVFSAECWSERLRKEMAKASRADFTDWPIFKCIVELEGSHPASRPVGQVEQQQHGSFSADLLGVILKHDVSATTRCAPHSPSSTPMSDRCSLSDQPCGSHTELRITLDLLPLRTNMAPRSENDGRFN